MRPDSVRVAFGYNVHVIDIARRRACVLDRQTCWEVSGSWMAYGPVQTCIDVDRCESQSFGPVRRASVDGFITYWRRCRRPVVDDVRSASAAPATACRRCSRARASMPTAPLLPAGTGRRATCSAARGSECPMPAEGLEAQHLPTRRRSRAAEPGLHAWQRAPVIANSGQPSTSCSSSVH
jgi:hypothetical protein